MSSLLRKPLSTVCFELARHAADANHELLAYILRMAAGEALINKVEVPSQSGEFAGVFDWDVSQDVTHTDHLGSITFSVDPVSAAAGLPISAYLKAVHPDDIGGFLASIGAVTKSGGEWFHDYRLIQNGRVKWISARGHVTLDKSGRPMRFPGVVFDMTEQMMRTIPAGSAILN